MHDRFITLTYYLVLIIKLQVREADYSKLTETKVTLVITFFKLEKKKMEDGWILIRHYKNQSIKQNLHGAFITLTYYLVLMMKLQVRGVDYLKLAETKVTSVITFFKLEKMKMNFV